MKEQSRDVELRVATHVMASEVIAQGIEHIEWDCYPEIGEQDWVRIKERAAYLAQSPGEQMVKWAYALFEDRADGVDGE